MRIPFITLIAGSALALGGCAYGGLGLGMGYGDPYYSGYGYGSPYDYGGGCYGCYDGYGSPYGYGGYGYGAPYGWYDNYYYPGTGYYVYDSYSQPHLMTSTQKTYWAKRQPTVTSSTTTTTTRPNWSGFNRQQIADRRAQAEQRRESRVTSRTTTDSTTDTTTPQPRRHRPN